MDSQVKKVNIIHILVSGYREDRRNYRYAKEWRLKFQIKGADEDNWGYLV